MAHRIITINRMYGSGGRLLGKALAEKLGIGFYDKELIQLASEKNQIPYKELEKVGLAAPQVTYVMHDLKEHGFPVSTKATTIQEAADEIMRSLHG